MICFCKENIHLVKFIQPYCIYYSDVAYIGYELRSVCSLLFNSTALFCTVKRSTFLVRNIQGSFSINPNNSSKCTRNFQTTKRPKFASHKILTNTVLMHSYITSFSFETDSDKMRERERDRVREKERERGESEN